MLFDARVRACICGCVDARVCVREVFFMLIGEEVVRFDFFGINLGN